MKVFFALTIALLMLVSVAGMGTLAYTQGAQGHIPTAKLSANVFSSGEEATDALLDAGEDIALSVYSWIQGLYARGEELVAKLVAELEPPLVVTPTAPTSSPPASSPPIVSGDVTYVTNVVNEYVTNNPTTVIRESSGGGSSGVSESDFERQVDRIFDRISESVGAVSDRIDDLADDLAVSFTTANLSVTGNANIDGTLTTGTTTASGPVSAPYFTATSATATSTFLGRLMATFAPTDPHTFGAWAPDVAGANPFGAPLIVNPASAVGDGNLISASVNGLTKFLVDAEGDVFVNSLVAAGSVTVGATNIASLTVEGMTTLGDSLSDIAVVTGKLGIGTTTPATSLDIYATDALGLPVGTTAERPASVRTGQIRYNTTTAQFEGYGSSGVWQGLGGVIDVDQDTYITAEQNSDEDFLRFFTAGSERMTIDNVGRVGIGSTTPYARLGVSGFSSGAGIVADALSGFVGNLFDLKVASTTVFSVDETGALSAGELSLTTPLAVTSGGTGATSLNDLITLGTHTLGNYVATVTGNAQIGVSGSGTENAAVTLSINADSIGNTQLAFDTGQALTTASSPTFAGLTLGSPLTVANGGTGAATFTGGLLVGNGTNTFITRTLTGPAAGITVSNGDGVSGNPTLVLANDLAALEGLGSTGIAVRSAADTWVQRTITGNAQITVTDGNGVSGNPTLSVTADSIGNAQLAFDTGQALTTASSPTFAGVSVSSLTIGGDTFDELVGDGLDISSGDLIFDCSDVAGTGLSCSSEDLTLNATGDWTGTLDGLEATSFLRSDASDSYTSGTLTFDSGTGLDLNTTSLSIADTSIAFDGASTNFNFTGNFSANTDDLVVLKSSGNVGVGTTTPWARFSVDTSSLAAGVPSFAVGSSTRSDFVVTQNGNIGIGTTSPVDNLSLVDVAGGSDAFLTIGEVSGANTYIGLAANGGAVSTANYILAANAANTNTILRSPSGTLQLSDGNGISLTSTGGNIGIGTTTPTSALQIRGAASNVGTISVYGTSGDPATTNLFAAYRDNTDAPSAAKFVIQRGGNVGIGTASPDNATNYATLSIGGSTGGQLTFQNGTTIKGYLSNDATNFTIGSMNDLIFADGGGATENMRITAAGNVGIGTVAPLSKLDVSSTVSSGSLNAITLSANNSSAAQKAYVTFSGDVELNSAGNEAGGFDLNVLQGGASVKRIEAAGTVANASDYLAFFTASGSERMRILSGGNVGIGTVSPTSKLDVLSTTNALTDITAQNSQAIFKMGVNTTSQGHLWTTGAWPVAIGVSGAPIMTFNGSGTNVTTAFASGGSFTINSADNTVTDLTVGNSQGVVALGASLSSVLHLWTTGAWPLQIGTNNTAAMTILNGGNVGIGTTNPSVRLQLGDTTSASTASPETLSLGGTFSNSVGANAKLRVWTNGSEVMGLGVSSNQLDYILSSSAYDHVFYGGGSERMRIKGTGNVGIGTASPLAKLHVEIADRGVSPVTHADDLLIEGTGQIGQSFITTSNTNSFIAFGDESDQDIGHIEYSHVDDHMALFVNNADRLTILSSGNVGIGTTNPTTKLSVNSGASAPTTPDLANSIVVGTGAANATNKYLGQLGFLSADSDFSAPKMVAYIQAEAAEVYGADTDTGSIMRFFTGAVNGTNPTERMVIDASGNVGIGETSPNNKLTVDVDGQSNASIAARGTGTGNSIEWGHANTAGYGSTLGYTTGSGAPFLAFHAEHGTNGNTYRTRGIRGAIMQSDNAGGFVWGNLATASADNQSLTSTLALSNGGQLTVGGGDTRYATLDTNGLVTSRFDNNGNNTTLNLQNLAITGANQGTNILFDLSHATSVTGAARIDVISQNSTFSGSTADATFALQLAQDGSLTERMRINSAGQVSFGSLSAAANYQLQYHNSGTGGSDHSLFQFTTGDTGSGSGDGMYVGYAAAGIADFWNFEGTGIRIGNGTEVIRISSTNVGIGTTTPAQLLSVGGSAFIGASSAGGTSGGLGVGKVNTTAGTIDVTVGYRTNGTAGLAVGSSIVCGAGQGSISYAGGLLTGWTPGGNCDVPSDERLKDVVETLSGEESLAKLRELDTVLYRWNDEAHEAFATSPAMQATTTQLGFLAQDVQSVFPELVSVMDSGYYTLDYSRMSVALVSGINALNIRLETIASSTASSTPESESFADRFFEGLFTRFIAWFEDMENGIGRLFAQEVHTDRICVKKSDGSEVCLTGDELENLMAGAGASGGGGGGSGGGDGTVPPPSDGEDEVPPPTDGADGAGDPPPAGDGDAGGDSGTTDTGPGGDGSSGADAGSGAGGDSGETGGSGGDAGSSDGSSSGGGDSSSGSSGGDSGSSSGGGDGGSNGGDGGSAGGGGSTSSDGGDSGGSAPSGGGGEGG